MNQVSFLPIEKHKNPYRLIIVLIIIKLFISLFAFWYASGASPKYDRAPDPVSLAVSSASTDCPSGSTKVAEKDPENPICKLDSTGCEYGDTIPKEQCINPESHNIVIPNEPLMSVDKPVEDVHKGDIGAISGGK